MAAAWYLALLDIIRILKMIHAKLVAPYLQIVWVVLLQVVINA